MKTLLQLLTEQREQKGITQTQLSALTGITPTHIARIEAGDSKPTMPVVFRICNALYLDPLHLSDLLAAEFRSYMDDHFPAKSDLSAVA